LKTLAVVVCNNGLGHIKRVLHVLRRLQIPSAQAYRTTVYVDIEKLSHFPALTRALLQRKNILFSDVRSGGAAYEPEFMAKYKKALKEADHVWSDNLVFPLKYRPDVFLTGSFLWSEIKPDLKQSQRERELLVKNRPAMIANKYFATPGVKTLTRYSGVGIYDYLLPRLSAEFPAGILLSCGQSRAAKLHFERDLSRLKEAVRVIPQDIRIYIEPDFFGPFRAFKNVKKADFTEKMFSRISAAAIRPGLGTVCDVLLKGGRIFAFFEDDNFEVRHNAKVLERLGLGQKCRDIPDALTRAAGFLGDRQGRKKHLARVKKIDFHGVEETVEKIREILH